MAADDVLTEGAVGADEPGGASSGPRHDGWAVVAQRASGIVLLVVVPVHLALTRVLSDPADANVPTVLDRWERPGWRLLECLLVAATAVHVVAATRVSLARSRLGRDTAMLVLALTAVVATAAALFGAAMVVTAPW